LNVPFAVRRLLQMMEQATEEHVFAVPFVKRNIGDTRRLKTRLQGQIFILYRNIIVGREEQMNKMTTEQAIEQLEDLIKEAESHMTGNKVDDEIPIDDKTALEMGIQALEKQVPKKVVNFMLNDGKLIKVFKGICPYCQCIVTNEYCFRCGQALDWGDENA